MTVRQVPAIGRIVHYRLPQHTRNGGEYRPAIIVRVWSPGNPDSWVQLQVFTDDSNDGQPGVMWVSSVREGNKNGQYIWPPYVPPYTPPQGDSE